ncbi:hypothetical protein QEO93_10970 [Kingella negevensis]|uniref:hypothetical protein n=1 Tax=Kingella negevensis TaxID=1522312 RepID=UPI002543CA22|nr:hypothetical protein [Kingella negevensis]WII90904.1 hypothetical protein QEO93_10970 [Kingella negevensis]
MNYQDNYDCGFISSFIIVPCPAAFLFRPQSQHGFVQWLNRGVFGGVVQKTKTLGVVRAFFAADSCLLGLYRAL